MSDRIDFGLTRDKSEPRIAHLTRVDSDPGLGEYAFVDGNYVINRAERGPLYGLIGTRDERGWIMQEFIQIPGAEADLP